MNEESFEKLDPSLENEFRPLYEKKVPPEVLAGFNASVEEKIRAQKRERWKFPFPLWIPSLVPVLAVLVIFVWTAVLKPSGQTPMKFPPNETLPLAVSIATTNLSEEIAVLEEFGIWTDEDDRSVDTSLADF